MKSTFSSVWDVGIAVATAGVAGTRKTPPGAPEERVGAPQIIRAAGM